MIIPTTIVSVLRGDEDNPAVDEWGDPIDSDTTVAIRLPAAIRAVNSTTFDPGSGQRISRQSWAISFRPRAFDFRVTDRVVDEETGQVYQVETVDVSPARLMQGVIHLYCTQVS
jgi:hypothetical protein